MTIAVVLLEMNCWPQLTRVKGIALNNNPTRVINPQIRHPCGNDLQ